MVDGTVFVLPVHVHDPTGSAVTTLCGIVVGHSFLDFMWRGLSTQTFHRRDFPSIA